MSEHRYVVIVGCGRLGSHLANSISHEGHSVVVVDRKESAFGRLTPEFSGFRVKGDATELGVLRQAAVEKADVVIATTNSDNINLMVAQFARVEFGAERVLARVLEPRRKDIYRTLGVETISPTSVAAKLFIRHLGIAEGAR